MYASTTVFESYRPRLFGVAYRMLGTRADAEDALQDVFLRWHQSATDAVQSPIAWLVSTTTRLCIDRLRALKHEREQYTGPWLPEPIVEDAVPSPESQLEFADDVSIAFLAVLERLCPTERAAFLLREVFDYEYCDIAEMLGRSEAACRQLVCRALARVRESRSRAPMPADARERLLRRFMAAASSGNKADIMQLLKEDAEYTSDGGGKVIAALKVLHGNERIGRLFYCIARHFTGLNWRVIHVNGELGAITTLDGEVFSVLSFAMDGDQIRGIYNIRNPDKLAHVPYRDADARSVRPMGSIVPEHVLDEEPATV